MLLSGLPVALHERVDEEIDARGPARSQSRRRAVALVESTGNLAFCGFAQETATGAWGPGIFENDTAADWASGLEGAVDTSLIDATLSKVLAAGGEHLDASDAEEGLAAAEAVARMKGRWGARDSYTEPLDKWVGATKIEPEEALVQKATAVVARVLSPPSELLELWTESDDFDTWKAAVTDLRARLAD